MAIRDLCVRNRDDNIMRYQGVRHRSKLLSFGYVNVAVFEGSIRYAMTYFLEIVIFSSRNFPIVLHFIIIPIISRQL